VQILIGEDLGHLNLVTSPKRHRALIFVHLIRTVYGSSKSFVYWNCPVDMLDLEKHPNSLKRSIQRDLDALGYQMHGHPKREVAAYVHPTEQLVPGVNFWGRPRQT
jgi:hypothetical protein